MQQLNSSKSSNIYSNVLQVLLGDDRGALHICSLHSEKLLAIKQVTQSRITAILCCGTTSTSKPSSAQIAPSAVGSSNKSSSVTQFVVLSAEGMGLWQLRRGISHDILPGGHKQAVIAVQICQANVQVTLVVLFLLILPMPVQWFAAPAVRKLTAGACG